MVKPSRFDKLINKINIEILSFKNCVLGRYQISDSSKYKNTNYYEEFIGETYVDISRKIKRSFLKLKFLNPIRLFIGNIFYLFGLLGLGYGGYQLFIENGNFVYFISGLVFSILILYFLLEMNITAFKFWMVILTPTKISRDRINPLLSYFSKDFTLEQINNSSRIEIKII